MSAFGIDFGTTNSAAVELQGSSVREYGYAQSPLPSIVAIDIATGEAKAGPEVKERQLEFEQSGQYHVVRDRKSVV